MFETVQTDDALLSAFEDAGVGCALVALDGRCMRANPALARLLDTDPEALAGEPCPVSRGEGSYEREIVRADGSSVWLLVTASMARDEDGRPRHLVVHAHDITARKEAEAALRSREEQLRLAEKLESIGQLAAGIAHEINTPVQFIGDTVGFVKQAAEDLLALVEAQDAVIAEPSGVQARARIEEARDVADLAYLRERLPVAFERTSDGIRRIGDIVRAMRDFAHPGSGGHEPIDLNAAVRNTLVVVRSEYRDVADVETDLADLPAVPANGSEINQVLINLLVNAAHSIADSGTGERGTIRIATRGLEDAVALSISDTGCGIPEDVRSRIFDPFFTTKEVGRGIGQGLAIAHTLVVERHGGSLTFETVPGAGTTFHVRLPIGGAPSPAQVARRQGLA